MPKDEQPSDPKGTLGEVDAEVREAIREQRRSSAGRGPDVAQEERKKLKFARAAVRAMQARDERAFSELLRSVGVRDGSPEWERAWQKFRSV
jgi:hypothetical protein